MSRKYRKSLAQYEHGTPWASKVAASAATGS